MTTSRRHHTIKRRERGDTVHFFSLARIEKTEASESWITRMAVTDPLEGVSVEVTPVECTTALSRRVVA